ncbi:MAG TPA: SsrA-binding protein SmpB [Mycobacteriales bacterium]|nr:SsrA-binding protein SmpB [Mycobacteriales bacterium]
MAGTPSSNRPTGRQMVAQNKKARHDYTIEQVYEAGIVLTGSEVKSLREGKASLTDSYASVRDGEAWLLGAHIAEYAQATWTNHAPVRARKLLLHKSEIEEMTRETAQGGSTLVPLALYFTGGRVKVEIALAKGKKSYDKRQDMAERDSKREIAREMGRRAKGRYQ